MTRNYVERMDGENIDDRVHFWSYKPDRKIQHNNVIYKQPEDRRFIYNENSYKEAWSAKDFLSMEISIFKSLFKFVLKKGSIQQIGRIYIDCKIYKPEAIEILPVNRFQLMDMEE